MIVTIDGPAGAGKSTVAKLLAQRLGYEHLDTGAMYRAVTYQAMQASIDLSDQSELVNVAESISISFDKGRVFINGKDVSEAIREPEVTRNVVWIADAESVREILIQLQRKIASQNNYVTEGRDQGTVAFPDADCKFYLNRFRRPACPAASRSVSPIGHVF